MEYIHKLPFISGALMAIVMGAISYSQDVGTQTVYLRMAITLIVFYLIGYFAKKILLGIIEETNLKKEKEEREKAELESALAEANAEGNNIDYRVDDTTGEDDFIPLSVERIPKNTNT